MFPLFVDLTEKKILVVGAGKIASRRVKTLLPFAGEITVEAPEAAEELPGSGGERRDPLPEESLCQGGSL